MSNPDSFFEEVSEAVRRDRLFRLFRRYGWIAILAVLLIVGGAAWNEWRNAREAAAARALGDSMQAALAADTPGDRAEALRGISDAGAAGPVLTLLTAGEEIEAGNLDAAAGTLSRMASDADLPRAYSQLAQLKLTLAQPDRPAADRVAALQPLTAPGAPYRLLALEAQAEIDAGAGRRDAALEALGKLLDDPRTPQGLQQRATRLMVALGGTPGAT